MFFDPGVCHFSALFCSFLLKKTPKKHTPSLKGDAHSVRISLHIFFFYFTHQPPFSLKSFLPEPMAGYSVPPPHVLLSPGTKQPDMLYIRGCGRRTFLKLPVNNCRRFRFKEVSVNPFYFPAPRPPSTRHPPQSAFRGIQTLRLTFRPLHRTMARPAPLTLTFSVLRETAEPSGRTALLQTLPTQCGDVSSFLLSIFLDFFLPTCSTHNLLPY